MFVQIWSKYLPVIILLMKRSEKGEQVLDMNRTDFQRATGGKKIKLSFPELILEKGRLNPQAKYSVLAVDLASLIQENEQSRKLIKEKRFEFSMNSDFQLTIRSYTPVIEQQVEQ